MNETLTHDTLVDTCNFPSIRFGRYYTSRLAGDEVRGPTTGGDGDFTETVIHPEPITYTVQGPTDGGDSDYAETVTNLVVQGFPSVVSEETVLRDGVAGRVSIPGGLVTVEGWIREEATSSGATVISTTLEGNTNFGGIASDRYVTRTSTGATVIGKDCGPKP